MEKSDPRVKGRGTTGSRVTTIPSWSYAHMEVDGQEPPFVCKTIHEKDLKDIDFMEVNSYNYL